MTISEILQKAETERKIKSRFPVRVIFCESLSGYKELVKRLRGSCDLCWNIADFCSEKYPDKYPKFRRLVSCLDENKDKHILLLSIGEYLRMATRIEYYPDGGAAQFYSLWSRMESADSKTRIFIPVYAAKECFNRAIGTVDPRKEEFLWELDGVDDENRSITVYSDKFRNVITTENAAKNVEEWLKKWVELYEQNSAVIVTKQIDNWEKTFGKISVDIVGNPYDFLKSLDHCIDTVAQDSSPDEYWADLVVRMSTNQSINEALLDGLNLNEFDSVALVSQWDHLDAIEKWYVWLWYQLNHSDEYAAVIINKLTVDELNTVPEHIINDIIYYMDDHADWITQRQGLMRSLSLATPKQEFFAALDNKEPETALKLLSARTIEEKAYIIKTVCRWLRNKETDSDVMNKVASAVSKVYPELFFYLKTTKDIYKEYTDYFAWYKKKKLINRPVEQPIAARDTDVLDNRYYLMAKYDDMDCISYWIDGLGLEWAALVCSIIERNSADIDTVSVNIAKCVIPSETIFNEQWNNNKYPSLKRNRLDQISHKGMPDDKDYFLAIANQIQVITEMVNEAIEQLQSHEYVIITGDHGSSRLAALAFHRQGTYVPKGAQSMCLGRFCVVDHTPSDTEYLPESATPIRFKGYDYLVMKNYDHFIQPGNAAGGNTDDNAVAGEVHGGLTVEESVVPVIVLKRKSTLVPLTFKASTKNLLMSGGRASTHITFNKVIRDLQIEIDNGECECTQEDDFVWNVRFEKLKAGPVILKLIADNKILSQTVELSVKPKGIQINADGMGGLP